MKEFTDEELFDVLAANVPQGRDGDFLTDMLLAQMILELRKGFNNPRG